MAIDGLKRYLTEENLMEKYEDIKSIIEVTEFPHKELELNILQKIIRDADTMGGISDSWFDIVTSLSSEYGKSLNEFIPMQIKFLDTVHFNTPYCNKLLDEKRDDIKKKLMKIQNDLKN